MVLPPIQTNAGIGFATSKPDYTTYKSPYGPKYRIQPNIRGIALGRAMKMGTTLAGFGVAGVIFGLQFFAEVPKVRKDILQKVPVIGDYFVREIPPSDNPF